MHVIRKYDPATPTGSSAPTDRFTDSVITALCNNSPGVTRLDACRAVPVASLRFERYPGFDFVLLGTADTLTTHIDVRRTYMKCTAVK
jgi:hypothetical protein